MIRSVVFGGGPLDGQTRDVDMLTVSVLRPDDPVTRDDDSVTAPDPQRGVYTVKDRVARWQGWE